MAGPAPPPEAHGGPWFLEDLTGSRRDGKGMGGPAWLLVAGHTCLVAVISENWHCPSQSVSAASGLMGLVPCQDCVPSTVCSRLPAGWRDPRCPEFTLTHLKPTGVKEKSDLWCKQGLVHLLGAFGSRLSSSQLKLINFLALEICQQTRIWLFSWSLLGFLTQKVEVAPVPNRGGPRRRAVGALRKAECPCRICACLISWYTEGLESSLKQPGSPRRGQWVVFLFGLTLHWKGLQKLEQRETPVWTRGATPAIGQTWPLRGRAPGRNKEAKRRDVQECVRAVSSLGVVPTSAGSLGASLCSEDQRQG